MTLLIVFGFLEKKLCSFMTRAVGRSENPGVPVLFGGHNLPPLVEIGLTDLPKSGDAGGAREDRPMSWN